MLRGTRENISSLTSISNCAGVIALCFLLLATAVVVSPQANLSSLSHSAFAQEAGEQASDNADALSTLKTVVQLAEVKDTEGLEEIAAVNDTEQLAEMTGSSDSEELVETPGITSSEAVQSIVEVPDLGGLADLVGVSPDELPDTVLPEPSTTDRPTELPPTTDDPSTTDDAATTDANNTGTDDPATTDDGGVDS